MNAQDHLMILMNSISHYEMTSKSCFPGIASAPPKPHFYAPWFFDLPSDMDRGQRSSATNSTWKWMATAIWISSISGQQMPKVSNRCRCWIYNCTQILCDCKSTSSICSSTASEKTRTRREPNITNCFVDQGFQIRCIGFIWIAGGDWKSRKVEITSAVIGNCCKTVLRSPKTIKYCELLLACMLASLAKGWSLIHQSLFCAPQKRGPDFRPHFEVHIARLFLDTEKGDRVGCLWANQQNPSEIRVIWFCHTGIPYLQYFSMFQKPEIIIRIDSV